MDDPIAEGKRTALVWISADDELVRETRELCHSAGYDIMAEVRQNNKKPHSKFYLGPGKIREVGEIEGVDVLVTPSDLNPSQIFTIGKTTGLTVVDRIRLVLELFRSRATSPEARLQVEMADLKYQLPILKEFISKGTLSDRPGFLAGGEYRIDYYYDMVKKRISHIKEQLELERKRRGKNRSMRKRRGSHIIAVAGYTNAGKSTLVNRIADARMPEKSVDTADRMFTTIATTTRKMKGERNCIVTDTVGFIRDLPPWLVEGFMSTLEEVFESDVVLLVIDVSEGKDRVIRKTTDSLDILRKGNCAGRIILVMNKMDLVEDEEDPFDPEEDLPEDRFRMVDDQVAISATAGEGISTLLERIGEQLPDIVEVEVEIPLNENSRNIISDIRNRSVDFNVEYRGVKAEIRCTMESRWAGWTENLITEKGGWVRLLNDGHN